MITVDYNFVELDNDYVAVMLKITSQRVRNVDEDGAISLFSCGECELISCAEPAMEDAFTLYVRGYVESEDDVIVKIPYDSWKHIVLLLWNYALSSSHNTLEPEDVFTLDESLFPPFRCDKLSSSKIEDHDITRRVCLANPRKV